MLSEFKQIRTPLQEEIWDVLAEFTLPFMQNAWDKNPSPNAISFRVLSHSYDVNEIQPPEINQDSYVKAVTFVNQSVVLVINDKEVLVHVNVMHKIESILRSHEFRQGR